MSLRHGLLGLLAEGPQSGYDLARRFREAPFGPVWPAQHPKIYAELARLQADGLIEIESHGPRRRKAYRITDEGRAEIERWLVAGPVDHTLRLEPLLRSFFFWLMSPEDLTSYLREEARFYASNASMLRAYAERKAKGELGSSPQLHSLSVAMEGAIGLYESLAHWATWAGDHVASAILSPTDAQKDSLPRWGRVGVGALRRYHTSRLMAHQLARKGCPRAATWAPSASRSPATDLIREDDPRGKRFTAPAPTPTLPPLGNIGELLPPEKVDRGRCGRLRVVLLRIQRPATQGARGRLGSLCADFFRGK